MFDDPTEWEYVFEMWEEWATGPHNMKLPDIYMENSFVRTKVRAVSDLFYNVGYEEYGAKLDNLDNELSKCEYVSDFRLRLQELKETLLEAQAIAQGLSVDKLKPLAEKGMQWQNQQSAFAKRGAQDKKKERGREHEKWRQEAKKLVQQNPALAGNKSELARRIKKKLDLDDSERTIRNRL
ncbi:MAG: hypothetical protein KZQ87_18990 [Candidatus Thiodiazotropha sp. (ex Cardiolucina cf. quadrata)]|nr:hypothetical protein [Candidatus Thiodiazotropha sp. (ex Cardiolucina cf. quadrata)]